MNVATYLSPLDVDLALRVQGLNDDQRAWFEMRSAIGEFDNGQARREAELCAWADTLRHFDLDTDPTLVGTIEAEPSPQGPDMDR